MKKTYNIESEETSFLHHLHEPIARYSSEVARVMVERRSLFAAPTVKVGEESISMIELFAGVGGFRIGLERASDRFKTVWSNQWEPSTKRQDASMIYCRNFGDIGHVNQDIATIAVDDIPDAEMLTAGFPCQDYSVATTLKNSGGIQGKKGVLWWEIERIVREKGDDKPKILLLENVDRLLSSPASQRGRDFAIILASLSDLGYVVEWRIINAADYGMPQRRKRTFILAFHRTSIIFKEWKKKVSSYSWILEQGVLAEAFGCEEVESANRDSFFIDGDLAEVTRLFNKGANKSAKSPFQQAGVMCERQVWTTSVEPIYTGKNITLGEILLDESEVAEEFFISEEELQKWQYLKGGKKEKRISKEGYEYNYSEGAMTFPDDLEKPSRTIITGEGGAGPSRFKHVVRTPQGKYRRLLPIELERLNMFPDHHTLGVSDSRRAFLMGNALVTGVVERIGHALLERKDRDGL